MEKWLYVMLIKKGKTFNKVTKGVITRHAEGFASYTLAALQQRTRKIITCCND